jgi:hypothetical protein
MPTSAEVSGVDHGGGVISLPALVLDRHDRSVRPIMPNKAIEVIPLPHFSSAKLPFPVFSDEQLLVISPLQISTAVELAASSLLGEDASLAENTANFLYARAFASVQFADLALNSALPTHLARALRMPQRPASCRVIQAYALGLFFRRALTLKPSRGEAYTETLYALLELVQQASGTREAATQIRRAGTAAFCEALFFVCIRANAHRRELEARALSATGLRRLDPASIERVRDESFGEWPVPPGAAAFFKRGLADADTVVKHYCCKFVENVATVAPSLAHDLFDREVVSLVVACFRNEPHVPLRETAACTLDRLSRVSRTFKQTIVDQAVLPFSQSLSAPGIRIQRSAINILNQSIVKPPGKRYLKELASDADLVPTLVKTLGHTLPTMRAKALLALTLLLRVSYAPAASALCVGNVSSGFTRALERLSHDSDQYVADVFQASVVQLRDTIGQILSATAADIAKSSKRGIPRAGLSKRRPIDDMVLPSSLLTSSTLRPLLITPAVADFVAEHLILLPALSLPAAELNSFSSRLFLLADACAQSPCSEAVPLPAAARALLPALVTCLCESGDYPGRRHMLATVVASCLIRLLSSPAVDISQFDIYQPTLHRPDSCAEEDLFGHVALIQIIQSHVLTIISPLLGDQHPIPLTGLSMLRTICSANPQYAEMIARSNPPVVAVLVSFLEPGSPLCVPDTLWTVSLLCSSPAAVSIFLGTSQLPARLSAVLHHASDGIDFPRDERLLDATLAAISDLLAIADPNRGQQPPQLLKQLAPLCPASGRLLQLCAVQAVSHRAAACLESLALALTPLVDIDPAVHAVLLEPAGIKLAAQTLGAAWASLRDHYSSATPDAGTAANAAAAHAFSSGEVCSHVICGAVLGMAGFLEVLARIAPRVKAVSAMPQLKAALEDARDLNESDSDIPAGCLLAMKRLGVSLGD